MATIPADGTGTGAPPERRTEMDALRALVVVGLVFFHSALVFDSEDDFYVKNDDTAPLMLVIGVLVVWAMPLLFVIGGFGARQSLVRRGPGGFAVERLRRLGVPLVFATFVLLPLPQWLRLRAAESSYDESYADFYPRFFDVHLSVDHLPFVVQGEHFESGHLWFVVLLLCFSLLLAVPAAVVPPRWTGRLGDAAGRAVERAPALVLLPAVPLAAVCAGLGLEEAYGGWHRVAYLLFFAAGLFLVADRRFRDAVRGCARLALWTGIALFVLGAPAMMSVDDPFTDMGVLAVLGRAGFGVTGWCAVVAILGLLDRPRPPSAAPATGRPPTTTQRVSTYLGDAVLPLYVLHQPVVVAVAFGVVGWDLAAPLKYVVIVVVSLALTVATYDLLVRRTAPTRFLFGMR
ncbi:peptidoglycan/LPS O-acetylase OafA/YrhL [Nocardioides thalensis]|uniref:Peptidoglycan/LPS O-acetylase OafA/YrhL n=1 Tax=Nocardioides thalensis TaxID=1914755 RepID=A0A853CA47_9ACTN|nr:acyltransferase family protein [Nocardioides thalensis]NYJ03522.1 peptidoglycan/LPS O-acetylase OafA/YrhL [Nocardioides thalensis]